ncbi:WbuC family cupin fold metalloprotein [Pseudocitrobacter vendiensis]|uniref:Cupin fold metalloprotein, WbuC family n=1 Tax=Pseudocitrobacter vendiensis TaxID=2488306 RepID=A0ABN8T8E8_9ENTR|nr:WbuC family cupin fold metalloprotein [Pseudocitrobacter vendiensis]CAH6636737.1 Cupin fold metalloprotein, WbuC family [Pseudocitrobacter vendiensis]
MRLIDGSILDELFRSAENSERLRSHYLLHASHQEKVQRLLIAFVRGSYVEPHCHELPHQWEMFVVMQGQLEVCLYDENGKVQNRFLVGEGSETCVVEFAPGDIHSVECLSSRALMMEVKEGPFDPSRAKAFSHRA